MGGESLLSYDHPPYLLLKTEGFAQNRGFCLFLLELWLYLYKVHHSKFWMNLFYTILSDDFHLYMIQRQWMYGAKAKDKWDESKVKIGRNPSGSHAASTVVNMENGRCSCLQRPLWTWRTVGVRWLSQCLCPIFSMVSSNSLLCFVR